jgi:hypothetical protein
MPNRRRKSLNRAQRVSGRRKAIEGMALKGLRGGS